MGSKGDPDPEGKDLPENNGFCICCGNIENEYDSICLACKKLDRYPDKIYGV